nr:nucleotidyl transferase AbiEii/AbiGii toxin family protein [Massilia rhizosphaerae]
MPEDFNELVDAAMQQPGRAVMRPVVEKEILHYDIFYALDAAGLLKELVFQGGTSLRLCRGSNRFSEDLDFAGGRDFTSKKMEAIKACVEKHLGTRYGHLARLRKCPGRQMASDRRNVP